MLDTPRGREALLQRRLVRAAGGGLLQRGAVHAARLNVEVGQMLHRRQRRVARESAQHVKVHFGDEPIREAEAARRGAVGDEAVGDLSAEKERLEEEGRRRRRGTARRLVVVDAVGNSVELATVPPKGVNDAVEAGQIALRRAEEADDEANNRHKSINIAHNGGAGAVGGGDGGGGRRREGGGGAVRGGEGGGDAVHVLVGAVGDLCVQRRDPRHSIAAGGVIVQKGVGGQLRGIAGPFREDGAAAAAVEGTREGEDDEVGRVVLHRHERSEGGGGLQLMAPADVAIAEAAAAGVRAGRGGAASAAGGAKSAAAAVGGANVRNVAKVLAEGHVAHDEPLGCPHHFLSRGGRQLETAGGGEQRLRGGEAGVGVEDVAAVGDAAEAPRGGEQQRRGASEAGGGGGVVAAGGGKGVAREDRLLVLRVGRGRRRDRSDEVRG